MMSVDRGDYETLLKSMINKNKVSQVGPPQQVPLQ